MNYNINHDEIIKCEICNKSNKYKFMYNFDICLKCRQKQAKNYFNNVITKQYKQCNICKIYNIPIEMDITEHDNCNIPINNIDKGLSADMYPIYTNKKKPFLDPEYNKILVTTEINKNKTIKKIEISKVKPSNIIFVDGYRFKKKGEYYEDGENPENKTDRTVNINNQNYCIYTWFNALEIENRDNRTRDETTFII